ncbi:MAG: UvrD-helicase domain-containing protein, partial [Myxococcales bacterium]|nr:UvrD-helicase domain-containing protein [Myxococcales bacterium]
MSASPIRYRKPAVLEGLPLDNHVVIEASAGTGKTYTLEHLYIELLLRGATVDQILVVTFTEKATMELRYRVRSKLEEMVGAGPEADAGNLPPGQVWRLDDVARAKLLQALQLFDAAVIATIHAFCQRILTEYAFANRQLFTLEQVDRRHVFSVAFKEALRSDFARNERPRRYLRAALAFGMDVEQIEERLYACAIAPGRLEPSYSEAALVAALQGAPVALLEDQDLIGKSLKKSGVDGRKIQPITKRLEALAPLLTRYLDHQDPARFLQEFEELSNDNAFKKSGMGVLEYIVNNLRATTLEGASEQMFLAVAALERTTVPLLPALAHEFLPGVLQRLQRRKQELGHYDFDDMRSLVRDSLLGPGGEQLAAALRKRYRFALIDEFQDTD